MRLEALLSLLVVVSCGAHRTPRPHAHSSEFVKGKICIGTNGRLSVPSNRENHYRNLRDRFTNCTYVDGNLELTWLQNATVDLSFLQYIREVTGYVLISHVDVKRIVLPRLQIIRGRTLFKLNVNEVEFALLVTMSGTYSLELPALRDILSGNVGVYDNYNLCHVKTIDWKEIITDPTADYFYSYKFNTPERQCPKCHSSCTSGCWGEGPENCQKFSKTNCSPQCDAGRCFGPNPRECCHLFCAGGCRGPKQSDCFACRNFYDDGMCTQECPSMRIYNPTTYSWEPNPKGKYAYGATCVRNCPEHLLKDSGACVRSCPANKTAVNGECIPCNVTCPKTCKAEKPIHSGNIDGFKDCTIIDGSIEILEQSFTGFTKFNDDFSFGKRYPGMHPDKLEIFSTVKEITGYLNVQAYDERFTNLSYFRNLEVIGGRQLVENSYFASVFIVKTALTSLGLKSLKRINSGAVVILENYKLCFAEQIAWKKIQRSNEHFVLNKNNSKEIDCRKRGLVCDPQCSLDGCWGGGTDQCLSCQNYQFGDTCIENCSVIPGLYEAGAKTCKKCHSECATTCTGPSSKQCEQCKNVRDGPYCVAKCPDSKYRGSNNTCLSCHPNCVNGCTGPLNTIGDNACNSCEKAILTVGKEMTIEKCLQKNESCPEGYFYEWLSMGQSAALKPLAEKVICRKCHPLCKSCTGYGIHEQVCQSCLKFKSGEQCKDECPSDHYVNETTKTCIPCHPECRECTGPFSTDCIKCKGLKVYLPKSDYNSISLGIFNCTATCPSEYPYKIYDYVNDENKSQVSEPYCSADAGPTSFNPEIAKTSTILVIVFVLAFILLVVVVIIGYVCRQKTKARKDAVKMTMVLTGCEDNEPLRPTNVQPNLAKLRIVKEGELRKGGILGFGAFGKVYKGVWVPEGENVKIPVAIKVLREGTNTSKDFLEEAYIMASVEHPNLLQLLAVCMTNQMMLITQLMPLGCLLDYVRLHKEKIGSKAFLNWCTQIARGMAYLEEKRLVHRDLAARNVLIQTPNCVKITDFGLAKLLEINEDEYRAAGGKMPIKWLALECIQHRIFTHKSDVWAFGVTIWEILSYGAKPYENIPARNVPELIENGLKLSQPSICTLDIYCIMVSCWMLDADSRPTFKYLADKFAEMARDPGRYLVIPGDKFMRLPTYSYQDEKDLIKTLSSTTEGPEPLIEADVYLQPSEKKHSGTSSSVASVDANCLTGESLNKQAEWEKDMRKLALSGEHRHYYNDGVCPSDTSSSRYCTDPMKNLNDEPSFDIVNEAQVGNLKLNLPLDEDDYLMPSPQINQNATGYMDLIGDPVGESSGLSMLSYKGYIGKTCIDNPEYLMSPQIREGIVPTQTLGIPTNLEESQSPNESVPCSARQRSPEEESVSDHEYYNDLQRELQPLRRRNETTV